MSEMLGNRYFIANKFSRAIPELENALSFQEENDSIKKKLIICYIQVGQIEKALKYFYEILKKDPFIIINTDPYQDDCPCPRLVNEWENIFNNQNTYTPDKFLILGMLSLYCDEQKSIEYFRQHTPDEGDRNIVKSIMKMLTQSAAH
ncbi:MAG: tetratricopeptide repeat protein [Calditrichaceae bacterium]